MSGVLLAKVFGRQDRDAERYQAANEQQATPQVRQQIVCRVFFAVVSSFFALTPVAVYVIAGLQLSGGHGISSGTLVAITTLQTRVFMPLGQLLQTSTSISSGLALFTRVFAYLDLEAEIVEPSDPVALDEVRGEVRLSDVWQPGQLAAVVESSGAGKTTISYLVARL